MRNNHNLKIKSLSFIVLSLLLLLLVACGRSETTPDESQIAKEQEHKQEAEHIIITIQTMDNSRMLDLDKVMDAVNEITIREIGVEVEARLVDATDAFSQYPLWISNRETIDLMILNYQDITAYINKGMLLPLDDLLAEQAHDIETIIEEEGYQITEGSFVNGEFYGVAPLPSVVGNGGGLWIPNRCLEEADIMYDKEHIYSLEELTQCFAKWKELYPDKYPLGQVTSGNSYSTWTFYSKTVDCLGGDLATGCIMEEGDTEIVNLFATEKYYELLTYFREWYLAGYIYPDAAITDADISELIESGIVMTYPRASMPGLGMEESFREKTVCMRTSEITCGAQNAKSGFWVIPITSKNPQAAMRFLNMMFTDERISNLIRWGIEGEHYIMLEEESGLIAFPEELNASTVGYYNPLGLYGDIRKEYIQGPYQMKEEGQAYSQEALNHPVGIRGMVYSTEKVSKQNLAVQKVVEKYVPVLESGSVDLEVYYPEFLKALNVAGVEEIIADKQLQLNEWLASQ